MLIKLKIGETLYLYLVTSTEAVSSMLVQKDENRIHQLIYYTSKVLHNTKVRYLRAKKMIYALIISVQRLHLYFQTHLIMVLTDQSLKMILHRPDTSDWMAEWVVKLDKFDIQYHPRSSMKVQILVDFITECTILDNKSVDTDNSTIR